MKPARLNEITALAAEGKATLSDCVEIAAAALLSSSRHSKDIKTTLDALIQKITTLEEKIDYLVKNNSPVYLAVMEEEEDGEENEEDEEAEDEEDGAEGGEEHGEESESQD